MRSAIVGVHEYQSRRVGPGVGPLQIKAQSAARALEDAGLTWSDVDALYDSGDGLPWPGLHMPEYFDLDLRVLDTTAVGGSAYLLHAAHAMRDIAAGRARVALLTYGATPRSGGRRVGTGGAELRQANPFANMEDCWGPTLVSEYGMVANRYMHEFGLTRSQLAEVAVVARSHAVRNPAAVQGLRDLGVADEPGELSVEDVLQARMIADPLGALDCCLVSDGGGAVVIAAEDVAAGCRRPPVWLLGAAETARFRRNRDDLTRTGAARTGPDAFGEAGVAPADIDVAMVYDSFTITVLAALEDLGFCAKGEAGSYVEGGRLRFDSAEGPALNTDGGGLSSNHPGQRGIFLLIEAARQLRGESTSQVPGASLAVAHGTGGSMGRRYVSGTVVLGKEAA